MTRLALVLSIVAVLLVALACGWLLHWLWARLSRAPDGEADALHDMAERLHEAEAARDEAEHRLAKAEEDARTAAAERDAEMEGAMDTIGALRRQLAEWQSAYESLRGSRPED